MADQEERRSSTSSSEHRPGETAQDRPPDEPKEGGEPLEEARRSDRKRSGELEAGDRGKAEELKERSRETARQVKRKALAQADRRTTETADHLESVGHAMKTAAEELESDGERWIADYARRAAGRVDRMTRYLRERDSGTMVQVLEETARSNPGTFIGSSFAAGFALGRFLRSSEPEERTVDGSAEAGRAEGSTAPRASAASTYERRT